MIGQPRYGRLGTRMLPVKAIDTMQPIYGLTSFALLLAAAASGHLATLDPVAGIIAAKIALDLAFYLWSLALYRRWAGAGAGIGLGSAVLAALLEPFTFQPLRHLGAALGWIAFLTGQRRWTTPIRTGLTTQMDT